LQIDRRLNLVIPLRREDAGITIYVHSMPISRTVFEENFLLISRAFSMMHAAGLGQFAGPRVAAMIIKRVATELGVWEGDGGVGNTLMNEIHRLTNVIVPIEGQGWQTRPLEDAVRQGLLSEDEQSEVDNAICFFTLASVMHLRRQVAGILALGADLWETSTTLLNVTEYKNSLPTTKPEDNSGENLIPAGSSHPH
jgi:hypothetical protein